MGFLSFYIYNAANKIESAANNNVGDKFDIHFSAGFATYPTHGNTIEEIIHAADTELYETKAKRKLST